MDIPPHMWVVDQVGCGNTIGEQTGNDKHLSHKIKAIRTSITGT